MNRISSTLPVVLLAVSLGACPAQGPGGASSGTPGVKPGTPLAKVGTAVITVEDFEQKLNQQSPFIRGRYADLEKRREYLDNQVRFELLAQEAARRGLDKDPEVADSIRKIMVQKLTREEFDNRVKLEDITDAEIQKAFDENKDEYHKPEMVRVSHIFFAAGQDKAAAHSKAAGVLKQLQQKPDDRMLFRTLAQEHSADETSKAAGGDLRYLSKDQYTEQYGSVVAEAVFGLTQLNQLSAVVEGKDGYHLFKQTGRRQAIERTLDQVRTQIRNRLYRDKRTEAFNTFVEGLKLKAGVSVDEAKLAAIQIVGAPPTQGLGAPLGGPHGGPVDSVEHSNDEGAAALPEGAPAAVPTAVPAQAPTPTPAAPPAAAGEE